MGIRIVSSESLLLTQSPSVNFLVAWLNHLADPSDNIYKAHIIQFLIVKGLPGNIDLEEHFAKSIQSDTYNFYALLQEYYPLIDFTLLNKLELFGLLQYLSFHFGLENDNDGYLQAFLDYVLNFSAKLSGGLKDFLDWWDKKQSDASLQMPERTNAVRIMTIHKAKGLQFPVVIYPFADESRKTTIKNTWVRLDEKLAKPMTSACLPVNRKLENTVYHQIITDENNRSNEDLANLLYVAMTRPEERLYVMTKDIPGKITETPSIPNYLGSFLKEEGEWDEEKTVYQYGERWLKKSEPQKTTVEENELKSYCRPSLNILLRYHAPAIWDMEDPESNREWGNLVHLVMSKLDHPDQIQAVLADLLADGLVTASRQNDLTALISNIFDDPEIYRLFTLKGEVRNEADIISSNGKLYRPDRVIVNGMIATIIDFKTGQFHNWHKEQVTTYMELLREMDYEIDQAVLLYLNPEPQLIRVDVS
jgi:ATP-dependent exoDNAse (exonuclease V) beta subunit